MLDEGIDKREYGITNGSNIRYYHKKEKKNNRLETK
mgnify:CR=1 FL=1